jgi:hypothetical protein
VNAYDWITVSLIVGTAVAWIAWDVVLGARRQKTESMFIAEWARRWNALPFTIGALCAHWFMQSTRPDYEAWPWAIVTLGVVVIYDISKLWWKPPVWLTYPGLWLVLGLPVGHFFWPQRWVP